MIHYQDTTFCSGDGCTEFKTCPRALTQKVLKEATRWWGGPDAPIARFENPRELVCYKGPDVKQFLKG